MDIYSQNFKVNLSDVGKNSKITNKGFLRIFQEIGCAHSSLFGFGLNDVSNTGLFWIILNWKLQVFSRPTWNSTLKVSTWCTHYTHIFFYRDYKVLDEEGNIVAIATSKWILFDFNKSAVFKITDEFSNNYCKSVSNTVFKTKMVEKLKAPENSKSSLEYTVLKRDIDSNNHVNNLNYLDFASEILPESKDFKNVEVMYKNEAKLGNTLELFYSESQEASFVTIKNKSDGTLHCIIKLY